MRFGVWEIILIIVLALVLFGGNKLAGVGKALGKSIREFKQEVKPEDEQEKDKAEDSKSEERRRRKSIIYLKTLMLKKKITADSSARK